MTAAATTTAATTTATAGAIPLSASSSDNILRLFPEITAIGGSGDRAADDDQLQGYDEEQIRLMDEVCIVVDENDQAIGNGSKKTCHLMENINKGLLHRAFSVFLFDEQNRLLLQQRASEKITFPDLWTNTCCSHPLGIPGETGNDLAECVMGVKRAAQRKLDHELGIRKEQVPLEEFHFLTRIHYVAPSDGKWGEHEVDYILFIKPSAKIELAVSPNEVRDTAWVTQDELKAMFQDPALQFTPWFKLICQSMLFDWWAQMEQGSVQSLPSDDRLRRMLEPPA